MPAAEERLRGSGVLVTGGGTGIGKACAARLAAEGAVVMICGRTESSLEAVVADLASAGLTANYTVADVTQEADVARAIERTVQAAGARWFRTICRTPTSSCASSPSMFSGRCCA